MKSLLLLPLLLLGVQAGPSVTQCYTEPNLSGNYLFFDNYAPDLYSYNFDNVIDSVHQTGMWVYYENYDYNVSPGRVYFVHGIDITVSFPSEYCNIMSSLRFVGSLEYLNADTITLYEGASFTAAEFYAVNDMPNLFNMAGKVSSMVLTGKSPWTIYTGENFSGNRWCVYPDTDHDVGSNGVVLDLGIYPSIVNAGLPDNSIYSVRKGCRSRQKVRAPALKTDGHTERGAWGPLKQ